MTKQQPQRLTVLGAGSVGLGVAAAFSQAGHAVTLLAQGEESVDLLRREGIHVTGVSGEHTIAPSSISVDDAHHPKAGSLACDVLILATKTYQVADAVRSVVAQWQAGGQAGPRAVLLMQNGWGSADEARALLPPDVGLFSSMMMIGSERRAANHVNINGVAGPLRIGTLFGSEARRMQALATSAAAGLLSVVYEPAIESAMLDKFLFNCCLNAMGALTGQTYGELVTHSHSRQLIVKLADEAIGVLAAARNYQAAAPDGTRYMAEVLIPIVIPNGATHRSSMVQDVAAGRRTEIDYLNGAIVDMGRTHGIGTPFNEAIFSLVHAQDRSALQGLGGTLVGRGFASHSLRAPDRG